jgi:hypothetical protein
MNIIKLVSLSLLLSIWLVGCGEDDQEKTMEKQIEHATGGEADVDMSRESISITSKTDEGEVKMQVGGNVALPDAFPEDVFVYPGAKIESAIQMPEGFSVNMLSSDKKDRITESYQKQMAKKGWTMQTSMDMGSQLMLIFEKNERAANVAIVDEGSDGVRISLTISNN